MSKIGNALKEARLSKGLSLRELEKLSGIDNSNISKIEQGKCDARFSTLNKLTSVMGYDITLVKRGV